MPVMSPVESEGFPLDRTVITEIVYCFTGTIPQIEMSISD